MATTSRSEGTLGSLTGIGFGFLAPPAHGTRLPVAVAQHIEQMIVGGVLVPGTMLPPERVLGKEFGVSRTVVREAMKSLEREGLVEILHGKGVRVRAKSADSVAESFEKYLLTSASPLWSLLELRRVIETGAAELAAGRRTQDDLNELQAILDAMQGCLDDPLRYVGLDLQLHRALYKATHNPLVEVVLEPFMRLLEESRKIGALASQAPRRSFGPHVKIVSAIRAGDASAARQAMEEHFDRVEQFLAESIVGPQYEAGTIMRKPPEALP